METLNPFTIAQQQLDEAAELLGLDRATHELLRWPMREYHVALPVKMAARLLFRIKDVWVTPWFNV